MTVPFSRLRPWEVLVRMLRFFYLLWGGLLVISLVVTHRLRIPDFLWEWPLVVSFLNTAKGKALLFGIGVTMVAASLFEAWELVDRLLLHMFHENHSKR